MGKKTATTNSTSTSQPWGPGQGYITDALGGARNAYDNAMAGKISMPQQWYARPTADQTAGTDYLRGIAPGLTAGAPELRQLGLDTIGGKYLDPASNPFISGAVNAAISPLRQQLTQNVLSIGDQAEQAGAYGGGRQGVTEGVALGAFNRDAMNTASNIYYNNYQTERDRQLQGGSLLSQANSLFALPGETLSAIGGDEQQQQQAALNAEIQKWQAGQAAQFQPAQSYADIVSALTSPYGTKTGTSTAPIGTGLGQGITGGLGGASTGFAIGGPVGAAVGGGLGFLGGLFG